MSRLFRTKTKKNAVSVKRINLTEIFPENPRIGRKYKNLI